MAAKASRHPFSQFLSPGQALLLGEYVESHDAGHLAVAAGTALGPATPQPRGVTQSSNAELTSLAQNPTAS